VIWIGWTLFIVTLTAVGFLLLRPFGLALAERIPAGFVAGSTALPLLLFVANTFWGLPVLAQSGAGLAFFGVLLLALAIGIAVEAGPAWRGRKGTGRSSRRARKHESDIEKQSILTRVAMVALVIAIAIFLYQMAAGAAKPLFGWDEYSFWLYAAKLITLAGGRSTVLLHNAYASYPLGFPYLAAWCYHLIGKISIAQAKWISPLLTAATLLTIYSLLIRLRVSRLLALLAIAITVWGTKTLLLYNWLAFGEMAFMDTYVLGVLYGMAWLRTLKRSDLALCGLFLGLSTFLRVDGSYVAIFTLVLLWFAGIGATHKGHLASWAIALVAAALPALLWLYFKDHYHARAGWITRLSWSTIGHRLRPPFITTVWSSVWNTISNLHTYPIGVFFVILVIATLFSRRRELYFLCALVFAQIAYLFAAYMIVFPAFQALHASSLDRYLMRVDPLIAVAFVLLLAGDPGNPRQSVRRVSARGRRRSGSRQFPPSEAESPVHAR